MDDTRRRHARSRIDLVFKPWWRTALIIGAVAWLVVLNLVIIVGNGDPNWLGPASVVPVFALVADLLIRDAKSRR